nr:MAG TPA: hypothetical protein [Caudoviricetes sp.]
MLYLNKDEWIINHVLCSVFLAEHRSSRNDIPAIEYQERELEIEALIARMEARVEEERIAKCQ